MVPAHLLSAPAKLTALIGREIALHAICPLTLQTLTHRGRCAQIAHRRDWQRQSRLAVGIMTGRQSKPRWHFLSPTTLLFTGPGLHVTSDSEAVKSQHTLPRVQSVHDNGCLNLRGFPVELRPLIENENHNPNFTAFDLVLAVQFECFQNVIIDRFAYPVFPEVETSHALVRRVREDAHTVHPLFAPSDALLAKGA